MTESREPWSEPLAKAFEQMPWKENLLSIIGLGGYLLVSGWGAILYYLPAMLPDTGAFGSAENIMARVAFLAVLITMEFTMWMLSAHLTDKVTPLLLVLAFALSPANALVSLLGIPDAQVVYIAWGLTAIGYNSMMLLWNRYLLRFNDARLGYYVTITTFSTGILFIIVSVMRYTPSLAAILSLPLLSMAIFVVVSRNTKLPGFTPAARKDAHKVIKMRPFLASCLYGVPMGFAAAYLIYYLDPSSALFAGLAIAASGLLMLFKINRSQFQRMTALLSMPILLILIEPLAIGSRPVLIVSSCLIVFFVFARSTSNRQAVVKVVDASRQFSIGTYEFGRLANGSGMLIGFLLALVPLLTGAGFASRVVFVALNVMLVFPGAFIMGDYFPKDRSDEMENWGKWKRRCHQLANAYNLTERQEEIMVLLSKGRNAHFMEDTLCLSQHTVRTHIQAIYNKLDVHSRQELLTLLEEDRSQHVS